MRIFSAAIIAAVTYAMDDMEWMPLTLDLFADSGADAAVKALANGPNEATTLTGQWKCATGEDGATSLHIEWTFNWDATW